MGALGMPQEIICDRVTLRALGLHHAEALFRLVDRDRERLTKAQTFFERIQTLEDQEEDLRKMVEAR